MNQAERRMYLIRELQKNDRRFDGYAPEAMTAEDQKRLLRAMMNVWMPKPLDEEYLRIEGEYLRAETEAKGITCLSDLDPIDGDLYLWQGDITTLSCDAIVNAANSAMLGCFRMLHSCIDNCIHSAAGLALRYRCHEIMSEQGQPIELIRDYAKDMTHPGSQELLADIEQQYGNKSEAIAIYEKLAAGEKESWGRHDYNIKLKDIYKENGLQTKYEAQLKRLLYMETGSKELLEEYKATVPPEDWEKVRDRLFDSFKPGDCRALHWYAQEGCMERLMEGVEACGYTYLKEYRKLLEGKYPERCLAILMKTADKDAERANKRQDYQHVARILRWMRKYPGGEEKAADLAAKYREAYPRRRAMIEELEGI